MTFTLSTKSRRVCAHPTSPCSPIPHTVLFFSIRVSCRISRGTLPRAAGPSAPRRSPHGAAGGCRLWRRAAGPLPPPPLALQLICGLAGGALGAREARGRGARRSPFCLPRRRSFFFVFCLAAARGASTAAAAAEAAAAAGALGAAPLGSEGAGGAQPRRAARRAAAPKAQRWPAAVAWRDACPPPVCWYHRAWHACHGARSLWQWPARCRSPTGPSQLPPTQRRLGCWLPCSFVRGRPPRRPERCRPRAR